jgi:hypothetical protein
MVFPREEERIEGLLGRRGERGRERERKSERETTGYEPLTMV